MYEAAWYVWAMVVVAVVGFAVSVGVVLYRGGWSARGKRTAGTAAFVAVIAWAVASGWLAEAGYYAGDVGGPIPLIPVAFTAVLVVLLAVTRLPAVSAALDAPGAMVFLTLPHTLRVMGGVFLIVMAQAALPGAFAIPAGLGDIAIGLAAPFVAWRLARGAGKRGVWWLNVLGLLDLVLALALGFLAAPGPLQALDVQPTTEMLTRLPLALVPTVAVPIAITLHIVALRRLRSQPASAVEGEQPLEVRAT